MAIGERDIAWALFLRPGQKFLTTPEEEAHFLMGYQRHAPCDERRIRFFHGAVLCAFS